MALKGLIDGKQDLVVYRLHGERFGTGDDDFSFDWGSGVVKDQR